MPCWISGFGSSKCTNNVRKMYSNKERLHFGGKHLKKTDKASQTATRILSLESSSRLSNSGYISRNCSPEISACSSPSMQPRIKHAIIRLSGEKESSKALFKIGSKSAKDAFNGAAAMSLLLSMAWTQTMPPLRILVLDWPARQLQFGMSTWLNKAGACCRTASTKATSSALNKKWTKPNKSIRAGTLESSGHACRARTGTSAPICPAAAAPAFRSKVSRTWRLALRSSHRAQSAPVSKSASLELKCSSYNCRRVLSHSRANSSIAVSTDAESHSSPDRIRNNKSNILGHSLQHVPAPARSNACAAPKIHGNSSSV
mmetsp:Transcript_41664/g.125858  ORF Transcript_41664/g.125858 Transcript_41664/m.125858 type:complete len:316 (-) Transcript_41664:916-1863(-)